MVPRPFISFLPFCLYTKFLAFPPSHFSVCVCVCVYTGGTPPLPWSTTHLLPEQNKKKARSTYSFLKYLTNSLMTTCTVYCWRIRYNILLKFGFFSPHLRPAYMSTYCLCIIFFFFLRTMDKVVKRWLLKPSKESKNGCQGCALCSALLVNNSDQHPCWVETFGRQTQKRLKGSFFLFGFALLFFLIFFYRPVRFGWPDFREITPANQSMVKGFFKSKWTGGHTHTHRVYNRVNGVWCITYIPQSFFKVPFLNFCLMCTFFSFLTLRDSLHLWMAYIYFLFLT